MVRESQTELSVSHEELKRDLELLRSGKGMTAILAGLAEQQRRMAEALRGLTGRRFDILLGDFEDGGFGGRESEVEGKSGSLGEA